MNKKITILYTIPNFVTAGSQFVLLALFNAINRNVFAPKILVEKFPEIYPENINNDEIFHLPQTEKTLVKIKQLARFLKSEKIDILHSWDYKSSSVEALACRLSGVKYIYTKKNNAWSKRWFAKSVLSTHIVYDNPDMFLRFFDTIWLKNKVTFIPHGVDTSLFTPKERVSVIDEFIIGNIGVLGENKNQLFIIKALTNLPNFVKVVLYGKSDDNYLKKLTSFIRQHKLEDRVTINGFVKNKKIPEVLSGFDILTLASKNEGLPVTLLEAMACGVPVLSSDSGGGARFIIGEEEGGFIYTSEEDYVKKIKHLISDPRLRKKLSEKGVRRINQYFTVEKEVINYENLYKKLV